MQPWVNTRGCTAACVGSAPIDRQYQMSRYLVYMINKVVALCYTASRTGTLVTRRISITKNNVNDRIPS